MMDFLDLFLGILRGIHNWLVVWNSLFAQIPARGWSISLNLSGCGPPCFHLFHYVLGLAMSCFRFVPQLVHHG